MLPTLTAGPGELLLAVNAVRQERSAQCFSQCLIKPNGCKMTSKNSLCQSIHISRDGWLALEHSVGTVLSCSLQNRWVCFYCIKIKLPVITSH